ncbi:MAG: pilus assembly protein [Planctomycetaceae bacterium]|nr:pilus assembly protein [Planctomycetaceae bacterium]
MMRNRRPSVKQRRGILTMELVLVLPILMFMLLGLFEFSFLFLAQGELEEAAQAGARIATLHGVSEADVQQEVERTLTGRLASNVNVNAVLGEYSGDDVVVTVSVPSLAAAPDLLWAIGYSLEGQTITAHTRMTKE